MRPLLHSIGLAVLAALLGAGRLDNNVFRATGAPASLPPGMKAYVETIPGTDLKFEMVPIPGGTFAMGSPAERGEAGGGRRTTASRSRSPRSGWASTR